MWVCWAEAKGAGARTQSAAVRSGCRGMGLYSTCVGRFESSLRLRNYCAAIRVLASMREKKGWLDGPEWFIVIGGCFFVLVLAVAAVWEADIRLLHFFQAWMYLAAMALAVRRNRWGYFIGIAAAGLWDYTNLFVNTFLMNGLHQVVQWVRTGDLQRPDAAIAVVAWLSNIAVVVGCVWGYARLRERSAGDAGRLVIAFAVTTGFFALDMALFQPRYLSLFPRMLHPHWP